LKRDLRMDWEFDRALDGNVAVVGELDLSGSRFTRQARRVPAGATLRIQDRAAFRLRWTLDGWGAATELDARTTPLGIHYADVLVPEGQQAAVRFTFLWPEAGRWEGRDFAVEVAASGPV
jgi:glucoamylase